MTQYIIRRLLVAIPGLLASRWLDRREQRLGTELQRLRGILHVRPAGGNG